MTVVAAGAAVVILSSSWRTRESELSFVTRAIAGALSRCATVTVVTPMEAGTIEHDGAFDLVGIGVRRGARWPELTAARWSPRPDPGSTWILDEPGDDARALLGAFGNVSAAFSIAPIPPTAASSLRQLPLVAGPTTTSDVIGLHVPVNPLAGAHRHTGLGFTGYVLVLTDRPDDPPVQPPTPAVAWLTSRLHDRHVVVVEGGTAAAWKGRALRGVVGVDTRTDLRRLLAHASLTVDLAPGNVIGRERIESLILGTPIVVPKGSTAAAHADAGGGLTYSGVSELLAAVELLADDGTASDMADRGRRYAEEHYGDAARFVDRLSTGLGIGHP